MSEGLPEHLADPRAVSADVRACRARPTISALLPLAVGVWGLQSLARSPVVARSPLAWIALGIVAVGVLGAGAVPLIRATRRVDRARMTVYAATRTFWTLLAARPGVIGALIAPQRRLAPLAAPALPPALSPVVASFVPRDERAIRAWTSTFGRSTLVRLRWVRWLWTRVVDIEGDRAETETAVWCGTLPTAPFLLAVPCWAVDAWLGAGAFVLVWAVTVRYAQLLWTQRWVRGEKYAWYLVDADDPERVRAAYERA